MRDVASLYGDPEPSLMSFSRDTSREPEGLDPRDDFYSSALEPDGFRVDEKPEPVVEQQDPEEKELIRHFDDNRDDGTLGSSTDDKSPQMMNAPIDLKKLVGIPPPPPPTAPPPKRNKPIAATARQSSTFTSDTFQGGKSVSSFKENEVETSSFDKEDAVENNNIRVTVPPSPAESTGASSTRSTTSSTGPLKDRSSSTKSSASMQKARSIMKERRKLAVSLYESPHLVLEDDNAEKEEPNPDMPSFFSKSSMAMSPRDMPLSPTVRTGHTRTMHRVIAPLESPSSAATKTHSNQTIATPTKSSRPGADAVESNAPSSIADSSQAPMEQMKVASPKSPERVKLADRRPRSQHAEIKKEKKRGFLGKLFKKRRGKDRTPAAGVSVVPEALASQPETETKRRFESTVEKVLEDITPIAVEGIYGPNLLLSPKAHPTLKPALKGVEERHYQASVSVDSESPALKRDLTVVEDVHLQGSLSVVPELVIGLKVTSQTNEASEAVESISSPQHNDLLPSSSAISEASALKLHSAFSQDPPDEEHGDPPMQTGPPVLSPANKNLRVDPTLDDDEKSRIESVRSRIAEVYEEHLHPQESTDHTIDGFPASISNDQENCFEPQDEVSLLTGPSFESFNKKKSFDPSPKNIYETQNMFCTEDRAPSLRVEIQEHSMEPAGASPTVLDSTRVDEEPRRPVFGDPVGDSPASCKEVRAPSNDPLGMSPAHVAENTKSPSELAMAFLSGADRIEIMQLEGDVGDPPLADGYLSDDTGLEAVDVERSDMGLEAVDKERSNVSGTSIMEHNEKVQSTNNNITVEEDGTRKMDMTQPAEMGIVRTKDSAPSVVCTSSEQVAQPNATTPVLTQGKIAAPYRRSTSGGVTSVRACPSGSGSTQLRRGRDTTIAIKETNPVKNDIEKAGFKSASNTPTAADKPLTISAAAFTNAKAVAYIHQLHGDPSPRHSWHVSKSKQHPSTPSTPKRPFLLKKMKKVNSKKKKGANQCVQQKKAPSPYEYCATNLHLNDLGLDESDSKKDCKDMVTPKSSSHSQGEKRLIESQSYVKKKYVNNGLGSRFQGRRPTKKNPPKLSTSSINDKIQTPDNNKDSEFSISREDALSLVVPLGKITGMAVSRGVELRRIKREKAIASGLSERVILTPRQKPTGGNRFKMIRSSENDIKDPIKRAGRRLLSKAAVPIQAAARRYLARQEALDRMWAIVQVQSIIRRWRCETNFQAHIHSAVLIQKTARGWLAREQVQDSHLNATKIQKIVRGYLAAVHVYDAIYYVCRLQALARSFLARAEIARKNEAAEVLQAFYAMVQERKRKAATDIQRIYRGYKIYKILKGHPHVVGLQTLFRGYKARKEYSASRSSACVIQKYWRSYSACVVFQMQVADIITVQSVVRRWLAVRKAELVRFSAHSEAVVRIQSAWRAYKTMKLYKQERAAVKIQSTWRGFQAYTDYIFLIVDVLVVQRKVRQWLAVKRIDSLRKDRAALVVQTAWRRHQAQRNLLYSLVHIIMVQSIARRLLSKSAVALKRKEYEERMTILQKKNNAAIVIQKAWRGFWGYSHFVIVRYEISRIQALMRKRLAKRQCKLRLGCIILIQATARRFLARNAVIDMAIKDALIASKSQELRERNAANHIQFWWRIVLDWTKEKKAALTIERFFIFVKGEVDREIRKREIKRIAKEKKRKERRRQSEDNLLEKVWLNTLDENSMASSSNTSTDSSRRKSSPVTPTYQQATPNKGINPKLHLGGFNEPVSFQEPPTLIQHASSQDFSIVSNITNPSVFHKMSKHQLKTSQTETTEALDFDFSQSFQKEVRPRSARSEKKHRLSTEDYIRKYSGGLKTAPNRLSQSESSDHFFTESGMKRQSSNGTPTTCTQSHTQVPTPQSSSGSRLSSSKKRNACGTTISISVGTVNTPRATIDASPQVPSTPRSTTNSRSGSTPRGFPSSSNRRRESSSPRYLPPVTPTSRQKHQQHHIIRRGTSETESQTTISDTYYSISSPRRHSGGIHGRGGNNPVMIMKTYPELEDGESIQEAHEVLLLGDEYGEV
ncbi:IQ calmodulin-binding motif-containing protein [Nitzschia inconspicua]|uniref:IQ calmodulin-binding motif-containing protein n=1 Tax=Nitzschia inconspicua TaxID=303405 RepID=A0A9K3KM49_9STRA|nr:IQ calmodulin-binding motif-containing protein [Nitzschia inconspicua]